MCVNCCGVAWVVTWRMVTWRLVTWRMVTWRMVTWQVRMAHEEAQNHNLLTSEGRRAFASRMRTYQMQREREESEDTQEML